MRGRLRVSVKWRSQIIWLSGSGVVMAGQCSVGVRGVGVGHEFLLLDFFGRLTEATLCFLWVVFH